MSSFKPYFCALLLLLFVEASGQMQLYGLQHPANFNPHQPTATDFNLISMEPFSGSSSTLLSVPNSFGVANGASTFDHGCGRYIFIGPDDNHQSRIYHIDVNAAQLFNSAPTTDYPSEIEYDLQRQTSYGLRTTSTGGWELVEINAQTGNIQSIGALPGLQALFMGTATYDSNAGRYFFIGRSNQISYLYTVRSSDATILQQTPLITGTGNLAGLEYSLVTDELFALHFSPNTNLPELVELDPQTAQVQTVVASTDLQLQGMIMGGVAFDQNTQTYVVEGPSNGGYALKLIDVQGDSLLQSHMLPAVMHELQVDNSVFAARQYLNNSFGEDAAPALRLWPNPSTGQVQLEGLSLDKKYHWELLDVQGRLWREGRVQGQPLVRWQWEDVPPGSYYLRLNTAGQQQVKPLLLLRP